MADFSQLKEMKVKMFYVDRDKEFSKKVRLKIEDINGDEFVYSINRDELITYLNLIQERMEAISD